MCSPIKRHSTSALHGNTQSVMGKAYKKINTTALFNQSKMIGCTDQFCNELGNTALCYHDGTVAPFYSRDASLKLMIIKLFLYTNCFRPNPQLFVAGHCLSLFTS
jgi:hypothetical protein